MTDKKEIRQDRTAEESPFSLMQLLRRFFDSTALSDGPLSTRAVFNLLSGTSHDGMTERQVIDELNTVLQNGLGITNPCRITEDGKVSHNEIVHAIIHGAFGRLSGNSHGLSEQNITKESYPEAFHDAFMLNYDYELYLDAHEMTGLVAAEVLNDMDWLERLKPSLEMKDAEPVMPEMEIDQIPLDSIPRRTAPAPTLPPKKS